MFGRQEWPLTTELNSIPLVSGAEGQLDRVDAFPLVEIPVT
jgi:hypothetical protein